MEAAPPLDLISVLSESKRIINAHSRHFLALSVLFLLPISFSITSYPTLYNLIISNTLSHTSQIFLKSPTFTRPNQQPNTVPINTLFLSLAFTLFVSLLSLFSLSSITNSVFHCFYGRPVKFLFAIKSIFRSFFPLFATLVLYHFIVLLICVVFATFLFLGIKVVDFSIGFETDFSSPYFPGFLLVVLVVLVLVLVNLQVNWSLISVISVVELSWGFYPLRRSAYLIEGMRRLALSLLLLFGFLSGVLIWCSSVSAEKFYGGARDGWKNWAFVLQIIATSTLLMLIMLYNAAANTVLYMYCKAIHGELAFEIAEEFAREYASLPFDDEKVPHVVSVAYP